MLGYVLGVREIMMSKIDMIFVITEFMFIKELFKYIIINYDGYIEEKVYSVFWIYNKGI